MTKAERVVREHALKREGLESKYAHLIVSLEEAVGKLQDENIKLRQVLATETTMPITVALIELGRQAAEVLEAFVRGDPAVQNMRYAKAVLAKLKEIEP